MFMILNARYSLYYSDNRQGFTSIFDCLYAYEVQSDEDQNLPRTRNYDLIPFCRRFSQNGEEEKASIQSSENVVNSIPFIELYRQGVTSIQLLDWSSSIDVAERYEENGANSNDIFYNCSSLWFGSKCQYRFDYDQLPTFGHVLRRFFSRHVSSIPPPYYHVNTCYPFLTNCYLGPSPMCLDWREICDGKFDCINGEDEQSCEILEMNECSDKEFRCHYSGECIPLSFLHDGLFSPDCLDSSDDIGTVGPGNYEKVYCGRSLAFDCEESTNRRPLTFSCGDGQLKHQRIPRFKDFCKNSRDRQMTLTMFTSMDSISNRDCRDAFNCVLRIKKTLLDVHSPTDGICEPLVDHCSSDWLVFPKHPIIFGFFQFMYLTNRSVTDFQKNILPDFVCFNTSRCPGLIFCLTDTGINNGLNCCRTINLTKHMLPIWDALHQFFDDAIQRCSKIGTDQTCSHPSLFHCPLSLKCISKHRLVDGFVDCYYREDELFSACQLNDSQRFTCRLDKNKCPSLIGINDGVGSCPDNEDEENVYQSHISKNKISFGRFCDGFEDKIWINMSNETDESHCDLWPCNNANVRCDRYWQCINGFDELNCSLNLCSINEHYCEPAPGKQNVDEADRDNYSEMFQLTVTFHIKRRLYLL
jgi:hypothetical protein